MINESTAIALQYGFFRKKELDAKEAKVVAFVAFIAPIIAIDVVLPVSVMVVDANC